MSLLSVSQLSLFLNKWILFSHLHASSVWATTETCHITTWSHIQLKNTLEYTVDCISHQRSTETQLQFADSQNLCFSPFLKDPDWQTTLSLSAEQVTCNREVQLPSPSRSAFTHRAAPATMLPCPLNLCGGHYALCQALHGCFSNEDFTFSR